MTEHAILLAVKPRFAHMLLTGEKTVELRRVRPRARPGDLLVLYASTPARRLVGACRIETVRSDHPAGLWRNVQRAAGVSRREYDQYFEGAKTAVGIFVKDPVRFTDGMTLGQLRRCSPGFRPPQSFRYVEGLDQQMRDELGALMLRAQPAAT